MKWEGLSITTLLEDEMEVVLVAFVALVALFVVFKVLVLLAKTPVGGLFALIVAAVFVLIAAGYIGQ